MLRDLILKIIRYFFWFIGYGLVIPLNCLIPKANYIVLISRFGDFEGNLKYLMLYLTSLKQSEYIFVFLTTKKDVHQKLIDNGFNTWLYPSFKTIIRLLRARIIIVDGNEWAKQYKNFLLYKSKKVQLWHAAGLKVIGLLRPAIRDLKGFRRRLARENICYDLVVFSSEYQAMKRSKAFRYKQILINGLPRNDIFFARNLYSKTMLGCDNFLLEKAMQFKNNGYRLITYAPTWRMNDHAPVHLDLCCLEDIFLRHRLIYLIKLHPKQAYKLELGEFSQVFEYKRDDDVYPLLAITDLLITDYSSIYLDFLLTDRPIIFYPYDYSDYIGKERELLFDYEKMTPGPKCYSSSELKTEIYNHLVVGHDQYRADRDNVRKLFFHYRDGKAADRLWHNIKEKVL
jgi:CDP-glycerol glycerophosphotransferase (TagB/SpsB family)